MVFASPRVGVYVGCRALPERSHRNLFEAGATFLA
jgi:hypothetical protein